MDRMIERRTGDHAAPSASASPAPRQRSEDIVGSARPATAAGAVRARILLADDNADRRDYLRRLLCERYTVEVVVNGAEALAAAQTQPPDLVLADVMMPELDGFGVLRALRGNPATRAIPVILLAARAGEEAIIEGPEADADDYLVKPFSAREVLARVASHLELARLRREAVARTSELEATIEAISDAVFVYDVQGNIVRTNSAARRLFGLVVDAGYERLSPGERASLVEAAYEDGQFNPLEESGLYRLLHGEVLTGANSLDVRLRSPGGRGLQVNISGAPLRNEAGVVVGGVAVSRDVTERRALERELRWQASMLERAHDAIFMWELGGPIVYWNRGAELLYGYRREEAVGRISHDLLQTLLPATREAFEAALEREGEWTGELAHTTRDGRSIAVLSRHQLLREPDGRRYVLETSRDVTDRKRLERRTREALDALLELAAAMVSDPAEGSEAPNGLATGSEPRVDETVHRFATLCSRVLACERIAIIAVEPGTELLRAVAVTGSTPEQEQRFRAGFSNLRLADRFGAEVAARLMFGETVLVDTDDLHEADPAHVLSRHRFLIAPMLAGDAFYGYIGVNFGDEESHYSAENTALALAVAQLIGMVMERTRLRHEREEARAREVALAEANRRMDEFLGIASHELRTPLTIVTANVQMAERHLRGLVRGKRTEPGDSPSQPAPNVERAALLLERTDRQILRLDRLVGDLLDASRIQAGKLELRREPCDLLALVREAVEMQRAAWSGRSIALDLPRGDAISLEADPDRIGQVVNNLLTNALKYSPPEQPVAVRVRRVGEMARVGVGDHGPGLSAEQQAHLFERFFRVPGIDQRSGSGVGLGLGLYICKTIVERHGGVVGVESAVGKGSTFWFTLPLDRDDPAPGAEQHPA